MLVQLPSPLPMKSPKWNCLAHFLIDYGPEHDLHFVVFQDDTGECWTWSIRDIRAQKNVTMGRKHVSSFYEPKDVALTPPNKLMRCPKCKQTGKEPLMKFCSYCFSGGERNEEIPE